MPVKQGSRDQLLHFTCSVPSAHYWSQKLFPLYQDSDQTLLFTEHKWKSHTCILHLFSLYRYISYWSLTHFSLSCWIISTCLSKAPSAQYVTIGDIKTSTWAEGTLGVRAELQLGELLPKHMTSCWEPFCSASPFQQLMKTLNMLSLYMMGNAYKCTHIWELLMNKFFSNFRKHQSALES